jgi:hypothetical protein
MADRTEYLLKNIDKLQMIDKEIESENRTLYEELDMIPLIYEVRKKIKNPFARISAFIYILDNIKNNEYIDIIEKMLDQWKEFKGNIREIEYESGNIYEYVNNCLIYLRKYKMSQFKDKQTHWINSIFKGNGCNCMCGTIFVCLCIFISKNYNMGDKGLSVCSVPSHIYLKWEKDTGDVETTLHSDGKPINYNEYCNFTIPNEYFISCDITTNMCDILILYLWNTSSTIQKFINIKNKLTFELFQCSSRSIFMFMVTQVSVNMNATPEFYIKLLVELRNYFKSQDDNIKSMKFITWLGFIVTLLGKLQYNIKYWHRKNIISVVQTKEMIDYVIDMFRPMTRLRVQKKYIDLYVQFINFMDLFDNMLRPQTANFSLIPPSGYMFDGVEITDDKGKVIKKQPMFNKYT